MKKVLIYYNFIIVTIMTLSGFLGATNISQLISASLFFPLAVYFTRLVLPKKKKAIILPVETLPPPVLTGRTRKLKKLVKPPTTLEPYEEEMAAKGRRIDIDRRTFVKLIGSAGLTVFFFSLFTNKAHAAFFGSSPMPGAVAVKDSAGTVIDPAIKTPTDGYRISEVDDSTPSYYGFVDKTGNWYIMQEGATGAYRYAKGIYVQGNSSTYFSTNWTNRADLTYGYFDSVF